MSSLIIDFFNIYLKAKAVSHDPVASFFRQVYTHKRNFQPKEIYYVVDSFPSVKRDDFPEYKENRDIPEDDLLSDEVQEIKDAIKSFKGHIWVRTKGYEADDLAFTLCRRIDFPICISEDIDWISNFVVNPRLKLQRSKDLVTSHNFQKIFNFNLSKIPLYLFLLGNAKNGVSKPFRLDESLENSVKHYPGVAEYCRDRNLSKEDMGRYCRELFPMIVKKIKLEKGRRTKQTDVFLNMYNINPDLLNLTRKVKLL